MIKVSLLVELQLLMVSYVNMYINVHLCICIYMYIYIYIYDKNFSPGGVKITDGILYIYVYICIYT
jgi:hypothetical protein